MSKKGDFLSGFSGGNTQKPLTEKNNEPVKEATPPEQEAKQDSKDTPTNKGKTDAASKKAQTDATKADTSNVAENKKLADKIVAESEKKNNSTANTASKPTQKSTTNAATRPAQSANAIIKAPEHVVTTDNTFHKRQMMKYGIIGSVVVVLAILGFIIFQMANRFEVPNFVDRDIDDFLMWQVNHTTLNEEYAYSLHDEGIIIAQSHEAGSTVSGGTIITVTVSLGPDMNEIIDLPDFYEMTRAQIRTWQVDNRLRSVLFRDINDPYIEQHHVIRVEFAATADPDNFRRNDSVTIYVSTGPETFQISNLVGDGPEEIEQFIIENPEINVEIEYEPNETVERGYVLRQSVASGTRLAAGETLTLTVSAGIPVEVPNFANMRMNEVREMGGDPEADLNVVFVERYHDSIPFGRFISQSVEAGEELYGENRTVRVVFSLGRPWIESWIGEFTQGLVQRFVEINDDGASIRIHINEVNHWQPRGTIVSQSHYNQHVNINQEITFEISRGNLNPPADQPPMDMPPGDDEDW